MQEDLRKQYRTIVGDIFPDRMTISFDRYTKKNGKPWGIEPVCRVIYEKVTWDIKGDEKGLRYGDNPGQPAALWRPINGNLVFGEVECITPGKGLVTEAELLQSGKHPGKTNMLDVDNGLQIMKYMMDMPTAIILKHMNPCGVASRPTIHKAYHEANMADRVAAYGGAIVVNRPIDKALAEAITNNYSEVVVSYEFEQGVMDIFKKRRNLRVMKIGNIERLQNWADEYHINFKATGDGGMLTELAFRSQIRTLEDLMAKGVPIDVKERESIIEKITGEDGKEEEKVRIIETGNTASVNRMPTQQEYQDMLFGWLVESGITSNSVIYVKDLTTVGIGTGEQDRVGVAQIARDKAYTKLKDRICFEKHGIPYNVLLLQLNRTTITGGKLDLTRKKAEIDHEVKEKKGGLKGAVMVSDAFFPKRDGIDVGIREGITAAIEPGGANMGDYEAVEACNEPAFLEDKVTMVFTGQRSFKH